MNRLASAIMMFGFLFPAVFPACAQDDLAQGSVIEFTGEQGELIVARDGIIFYLVKGDELFQNDVLRAKDGDTTTIVFQGCVLELPAAKDIELDDELCLMITEAPTMAEVALLDDAVGSIGANEPNGGAPLVVGGVVLSIGGLSALTGQGGGSSAADPVVSPSQQNSSGSNASSP